MILNGLQTAKDITQFNHVSMREDFSVQIMKDIFKKKLFRLWIQPILLKEVNMIL